MVALAKRTPHRVMRELYEQFIAYSRAYADRIPTYTPPDDNFALVRSCGVLSTDSGRGLPERRFMSCEV